MTLASMPKRSVEIDPKVAPHFLALSFGMRWKILEALDRLAEDPFLVDLREEDGDAFIISEGYVVGVDVDDVSVSVVRLRKFMAS